MSETITQTIERLTQFVKEKAPDIDVSPGSVFNELLINLEAQVQNEVYNDISDIDAAQTVKTALASLVDTYNPAIDNIASNYGVTRGQGGYSSGTLKIYVANLRSYIIPENTVFVQPSLGYRYLTQTTVNQSPSNLTAENGLYYFTITVVAEEVGKRSNVGNGTVFNLVDTIIIPGFVKCVAQGSFSAGLDIETDRNLINRFRTGLSTKNLLSKSSITNRLASDYESFRAVYLADTLSPVNNRSKTNPAGLKMPGVVDAYMRTGVTIPQITFTRTDAVYIGNNQWTLTLPSTVASGFYRILTVRDANEPELAYLSFTTAYGVNTDASNLVTTAADARYTIYQNATLTINFRAPALGETITFEIVALAPQDLATIQALFLNEDERIPCADYLVRGMIPCLVSLKLALIRKSSLDTVNVAALKGDIFNYINSLNVGEPVVVSRIIDICHNYNVARIDLPVQVTGRILAPYKKVDNVTDHDVIISGSDFLEIPSLPEKGIVKDNTMFYISYFDESGSENINITVN